MLVQGRIDRIDASPNELLVIDYKNARSAPDQTAKLKPEALGTTNFQVPVYLLAAARALPGREILSATYVLLRSASRLEPRPFFSSDPFLAVDPEKRSDLRAAGERTFADSLVAAVSQIRRGELPIASRDCSLCSYGAVCRFESRAEGEPNPS